MFTFTTVGLDLLISCIFFIVDNEKCTDIQETLTFQLGHIKTEKVREKHMATILKVSRGHYMPPPFTSVQEWFHYAFATTEIKGACITCYRINLETLEEVHF